MLSYQKQGSGRAATAAETFNILMNQNSALKFYAKTLIIIIAARANHSNISISACSYAKFMESDTGSGMQCLSEGMILNSPIQVATNRIH